MTTPCAYRILLALTGFTLPTRVASSEAVTWHRIVRALCARVGKSATYVRLLELLGGTGDAQGARTVRKALSALILGEVPRIERVGRGRCRLVE